MNKKLISIFILTVIFLVILQTSPAVSSQNEDSEWSSNEIVRAKILEVEETSEKNKQILIVKILSGKFKNNVMKIPYTIINQPGYNIRLFPKDEVILNLETEENIIKNAYITEYGRDKQLLYLVLIFMFLLVIMGGKKGVKSIISLTITVGAVFGLLLPLIFDGNDPILTTVIVAAGITTLTLTLIGGISVKTFAAIVGTTGGVIVAGIFAIIVGTTAYLTGFSGEEIQRLMYIPGEVKFDCRGILFAGMIIGALGAVMDVGMSIASAVEEVKKAKPSLGAVSLTRAGMNVGKDIMGTMANTLILAYTGGAIPLMLVFMAYHTPFIKIINLDSIATEVVRALAGSIGIVMAIPITSITAGILLSFTKK